jgi:transcriptional regulator with XRE-family HTH domain
MPHVPKNTLKPLDLGNEPLGKRIARLRKSRGLTQTELAQKIGITRDLVGAYEIGHIRLYDEMVVRFAMALNVTTDTILGYSGENKSEYLPSLRLVKRIIEIDKLPELKKKLIIKMLDELIKANS